MKSIFTKFIPASNVRGSRYKAFDDEKKNSITLSSDDSLNHEENHLRVAKALKDKMGWKMKMQCGHSDFTGGFVCVFVSPDLKQYEINPISEKTAKATKFNDYLKELDELIKHYGDRKSSYETDFITIKSFLIGVSFDIDSAKDYVAWLTDTLIPDSKEAKFYSAAAALRKGRDFIKKRIKEESAGNYKQQLKAISKKIDFYKQSGLMDEAFKWSREYNRVEDLMHRLSKVKVKKKAKNPVKKLKKYTIPSISYVVEKWTEDGIMYYEAGGLSLTSDIREADHFKTKKSAEKFLEKMKKKPTAIEGQTRVVEVRHKNPVKKLKKYTIYTFIDGKKYWLKGTQDRFTDKEKDAGGWNAATVYRIAKKIGKSDFVIRNKLKLFRGIYD